MIISNSPEAIQARKPNIVNKNGPIIIIEDDADDQEILTEIFVKLNYPNKLLFFFDGQEALDFINVSNDSPFLILSDINLPKLSGFALREKLRTDEKLNIKCIPYLFFSTALNQKSVIDAYSLSVQGFFVKQTSMLELERTIFAIMEYWRRCAAPNDFPDNSD
jgi:CheY-like chemotaxis protein